MVDLDSIVNELPVEALIVVLPALKILVDNKVFAKLAHANASHLVAGRVDVESDPSLVQEIRDIRQTNRILLGLEESAKQLTKGIE